MLYVLAATTSEPYRVFAATPVDDLWEQGSSDGHLAQTGDASMTYVIVLGVLGCISLATGRALRALRAARSGK